MSVEDLVELASRFERFGRIEAPESSPLYARLALAIAADPELLALAAHCRPGQPAPNLFLGAIHYLLLQGDDTGETLQSYYPSLSSHGKPALDDGLESAFRQFCLGHTSDIIGLVTTRLVQTNEVGRCAALLPALGLVAHRSGTPFWQIEVGASAGLNLLWDRYNYTYLEKTGAVFARTGDPASPVQFNTFLRGEGRPALPSLPAPVAGRIGIDLHPVDVGDVDSVAWLRALIWPEHSDRVERLLHAVEVARVNPPRLLAGDALDLLPGVLAEVPKGALLVIVHTFTLNQFSEEALHRFRSLLVDASHARDVVEVGIEMMHGESYARLALSDYRAGAVNVRQLARCDGHVRWLEWLA
jgi:hypothetical protein